MGFSVAATAWLDGSSKSIINTTAGNTINAGTINMAAGEATNPFNTTTKTIVVTGSAGGFAAGLNFGLAVNASKNTAKITGDGGTLTPNEKDEKEYRYGV